MRSLDVVEVSLVRPYGKNDHTVCVKTGHDKSKCRLASHDTCAQLVEKQIISL